jgi:NEDD8-activating enzyme E1 regulatory subunit
MTGVSTVSITVIESHSETAPSLRIEKPFPSLLQHAMSLNFDAMDPTDHGHVPYVVILVRALQDWKRSVRDISTRI